MIKKSLIMIIAVLALIGCSQSINLEEHFSLNGTVESLKAVNQDGEAVELIEDYKDQVWLSTFIFTNCDTVCSPMTAHIATLQKRLQDEKLDAKLVSFTIDPEYDSPEVLKAFGDQFGADYKNWSFLTGYSQPEIEYFTNKSYIAPAAKLEGSNQFVHSTLIYLMKGNKILEQYDAVSEVPYEKIIEDIKLLK
ncbi:SCO family protein [Metabacillus litoralis]|uniref:SCO family protein n=1 Tax=Metabacillus litoralis TaxID=152268 RepID=UPI001CFD9CD3|nr:SCO family protein [Metabacillus litoralis]